MKGVILAAGRGERLRPLTDRKPKSLLPICNKPLIEYQLELLRAHGIEEIAVVVGYLKEQLQLPDLRYYEDRAITGTATALQAAADFIDEDFILLYGDLFVDSTNFSALVDTANTLAVVAVPDVSRYGAVTFVRGRLTGLQEKTGSGTGYINAGIYHLEPEILDVLEQIGQSARGEYELTDALMALNEREPVTVVPLQGYWNDIGYPWDYIDANQHMLAKLGFVVGEGVEIWDSATIRKPAVIGNGSTIKNCVLDRSIIGQDCVVGEFSIVKRSIIMPHSNAPHLNYVADSVIAEGCNLGAGTKIANLRFDDRNVKMTSKGSRVDSGRRKLGAILGYNVKTGINVSIYPGVKISSGSWVEAATLVRKDV
ncbi:MAG: bifunctional sugar-1-phosphate nucleotidylyltransferase/acetyltransferase [Candidatus Methanospirareceae archaeon]